MEEAIKILTEKQNTYQQMIDSKIGDGVGAELLMKELSSRLSQVKEAIAVLNSVKK